MQFEFATAGRIVFGAGKVQTLGAEAAKLGRVALVVGGDDPARAEPALASLRAAGVRADLFVVSGEPTPAVVAAAVAQARRLGAELVVGCGGGSALDTAKATAAMLANPGELLDYLEVVGRGQQLPHASLPCICVPTTAGTGSEATRNAVLSVLEQQVKVSLRAAGMLPTLALVDPELTYSLPPDITASTGLDALTQVIEPFVGRAPNPLVDGLCRQAIGMAAWALERAYRDGQDREAREAMAFVSLAGGLALANAKLGAVHGFAAPLGGITGAAHGVICARLLPVVMATNILLLRADAGTSAALDRYREVARLLTGDQEAQAEAGSSWVSALIGRLAIPGLARLGLTAAQFPEVVAKAARASSMGGNPVTLSPEVLTAILGAASEAPRRAA